MAAIEPSCSRNVSNDLKHYLQGPIAFPITPFQDDGGVDLEAVRANVDWLADSRIAAIVAPSGTGEMFALSPEETAAVTTKTVESVNRRVPVIASVGYGPKVARDLAREAELAGADGILVLPPYYGQPDENGLFNYYAGVANAVEIGVMPYARDSAVFTPELVSRMASDLPNMIAFKDGRSDIRLFQRIREHVNQQHGDNRLVWLAGVGDDLVGPYFASGAVGFTSSLACFWPEASLELYRLASSGDFKGLREYHLKAVRPFYELRQRGKGFEVTVMKAAMELLGHTAGQPRPPLGLMSDSDLRNLRQIINDLAIPSATVRRAQAAATLGASSANR